VQLAGIGEVLEDGQLSILMSDLQHVARVRVEAEARVRKLPPPAGGYSKCASVDKAEFTVVICAF
jgi:hypothetical protein